MSERDDSPGRPASRDQVAAAGEGAVGATVLTVLVLHFLFVLVHGRWSLPTPLGTIDGPGPLGSALACVVWGVWRVARRQRWRLPASFPSIRLRDALRRRAPELVVGLLVPVALGLRVWGSGFGEPLVVHPDEPVVVGYAIRMLREGSLAAPEPFHYPTVFLYLMMPAFGLHFVRGVSRGLWSSLADLDRFEFGFYHLGRLHSAVLGAATVLLVFLVARRMWKGRDGRWAGAAAAALMTFSFVHVRQSHFAVTDVALGFFVLVAFRGILEVVDRDTWGAYGLAGFLSGIACATKYSALPVVFVLVAAHLLARPVRDWLSGRILAGLAAVPLGFLAGYPSALLNWPAFLEHLAWLTGRSTESADVGARFAFLVGYSLESGMGPVFALAALVGIVVYVHRRETGGLLAVTMIAVTAALLTRSSHRLFGRYLVPVLPFAALLAGRVMIDAGRLLEGRLRRRVGSGSRLPGAAAALASLTLLTLAIVPQAVESVEFDRARSLPDTRALARNYIVESFPPGMTVLSEVRFLTLPRGWTLHREGQLGDLPPGFLEEQDVGLVVFSDRKGPPDPDSALGRRRRRLRSDLVPVRVIDAVPGESIGPTVRIFLRRASLGEATSSPGRGSPPGPGSSPGLGSSPGPDSSPGPGSAPGR